MRAPSAPRPVFPPLPPELTPRGDVVDVVRVDLAAASGLPAALVVLSAAERERAARIVRDVDRLRFAVTRAALRSVLGRALRVDPAAVTFRVAPLGKLDLAEAHRSPLRFSVSHAHSLAAVAVVAGRAVGIDVELVRAGIGEELGARCLAPAERAAWAVLQPEARNAMFFEHWVRKEAYLKGTGEGLTVELDGIDADVSPRRGCVRRSGNAGASAWRIDPLCLDPAYAAAVAVEGDGWSVRTWQMPAP